MCLHVHTAIQWSYMSTFLHNLNVQAGKLFRDSLVTYGISTMTYFTGYEDLEKLCYFTGLIKHY